MIIAYIENLINLNAMQYLIYISTSVNLLTDEQLNDILLVSRKNNLERNITGVLLYSEGTFIQVLEGEAEYIDEIYAKIQSDPRHKNIIRIAYANLPQRNYPQWSMGFIAMNRTEQTQMDPTHDPVIDILDNPSPHPGVVVLKTFIENNRH